MKTIALNTLGIEASRNGKQLGYAREGLVKRCVEAGHLGKLRLPLQQGSDRPEIVRLVEWSERRESLQPLDHGVVDEDRLAVVRATMHHTMADGSYDHFLDAFARVTAASDRLTSHNAGLPKSTD